METSTAPSKLLFIDLDLLDDNPYQPRVERDELKATQLRDSIANQGQLQPILVRRAGARWQIIFGHGRVEALRRLRNDAKTEDDRSRFAKVRAEERCDVSDEQMLLLGLLENIQREDISPVDCAAALVKLRLLRPELDTIEAIAREAQMEPPKVKRLLHLHAAPQVIKEAVSKGKTVLVPINEQDEPDSDPKMEDVEPEKSAPRMQEIRRLDLSSALALARLYAHWCQSLPDQTASSDGTPDQRMAALINRVLEQDWGVRRVRAEVGKLARDEAASTATDESKEKDVPFKVNRKKLVIFTTRLAQMDEAQKEQLRSVLEPIWTQLGGQAQSLLQADPLLRPIPWRMVLRDWKTIIIEGRKLLRILQVHVFGFGKSPVPADQLPRSVQLPSSAGHTPTRGSAPPRQLPEGEKVALSTAPVPPAAQQTSDPPSLAPLPTGKPEEKTGQITGIL